MRTRVILGSTALSLLLAILATALCIHHYRQTEQHLLESRLYFVISELRTFIQTGLDDLELQLDELNNLQMRLHEDVARDDLIESISVFDALHQVLFTAQAEDATNPPLALGAPLPESWTESLESHDADGDWNPHYASKPLINVQLTNNFGQPVGGIVLQHHHRTELLELTVRGDLYIFLGILIMLLAVCLSALLSRHLTNPDTPPRTQLALAASCVLMLASLLILWILAGQVFHRDLAPLVQAKAEVVGNTLVKRLEYAMELGIPLDELVDMDDLLVAMLADDRQITGVVIRNSDAEALYHWWADWTDNTLINDGINLPEQTDALSRIDIPLSTVDSKVGNLELITTNAYLQTAAWRLAVDLLLAWLATLLLAVALIRLIVDSTDDPLAWVRSRIRGSVFLLALALGTGLLNWPVTHTLFTQGILTSGLPLLSLACSTGLMLCLSPLLNRWIPRHWQMAVGVVLSTLGLLLAAQLPPTLTVWTASGIGGGLGLLLSAAWQAHNTPRGRVNITTTMLGGLACGLLLAQLLRASLPIALLPLLTILSSSIALLLILRKPHKRLDAVALAPSDNHIVLLGLWIYLPIQAASLGIPLMLLLPWLHQNVNQQQQIPLLAALCLAGQLTIRLGQRLTLTLGGGAIIAALGGFLAGFALLGNALSAHPGVAAFTTLLMACGLGLSIGAANHLSSTWSEQPDTHETLHFSLWVCSALGLIIGPGAAMLGIGVLGIRESFAVGGLALILTTLVFSVALLLLGGSNPDIEMSQNPENPSL